jgi:hypothetical protein
MTKTTLILFWVIWLIDVLIALFGYREFINGIFGRYAAPSTKYVLFWVALLLASMLIIGGSLYFKNQGQPATAVRVAAIPMVLALPYILWLAVVIVSGKSTNWR